MNCSEFNHARKMFVMLKRVGYSASQAAELVRSDIQARRAHAVAMAQHCGRKNTTHVDITPHSTDRVSNEFAKLALASTLQRVK